MTVSTLRPSSTNSNTGAITGTTAHGALSDDSDTTLIEYDASETTSVELGDLTLPAGALVKQVACRVRSGTSSSRNMTATLLTSGSEAIGRSTVFVTWANATTTTIFTITPGTPSFADPTDANIDGSHLRISAGGGSGVLRAYEAFIDVTYVEQPSVTIGTIGTAGTVDDTNLPTISWTATLDTDGGAQTFFEVKVFSDAQYGAGGFDADTSTPTSTSGITAGSAASWKVDDTILADDTYRAYVRVAQAVNGAQHWSDWDTEDFTVSVDLPAVPDLTATADSTNARITLVIDANSGDATTDELEVQRSLDGGTTWETVRQLESGNFDGADAPITLYDYEAPNGTEMSYRARALHDYSGVLAASDWANDTATWVSASWWLKHPNKPALNTAVIVRSLQAVSRAGRQGVFQPLGSTNVVVVSDTRGPKTATLVLHSETVSAQDALDDLLDEHATLLLQAPAGKKGDLGYIRVGNHERAEVFPTSDAAHAFESLEVTVVASPPGVVVEWPS